MIDDKISTGSPGLDEVLFGGIPSNTISVIMGAPGTGKTILAEQMAFANARPEWRVLYLTTLSEPLDKFILHGQTYAFFDADKVGDSVIYEDLGFSVSQGGIEKLPELVTELLMKHTPKLVVIDSFKALNELLSSNEKRRLVTFDLASVLSSYQCTSLLVGEYSQEMMTELPEFAIADVVLQVVKHSTNVREQRFLRVEKLRGSNSIPGLHAFSITASGIELYPRLLAPQLPSTYKQRVDRVSSGIPGLDEMLDKGLWRGSTSLIAGPSGSGKTIMGLHFITEGARCGEPGVYVGLQENPTQIARTLQNFGWDVEKLMNDGGFSMMYRSPTELLLESVTAELFGRVKKGGVKRVVIDALGDLERSSIDNQRFSDFIYALTQWFAAQNVTCLMMHELSELFEIHSIFNQDISNMSDNIFLLRFVDDKEMKRTIRIIKTRGSAHDSSERVVQITNKGILLQRATK